MTEETLFELALKTPSGERSALLERACEGKPELRARMEQLLAAHDAQFAAIDRAPELASTQSAPPQPEDRADQTIGRYRLLQRLGEGGMGTVWVAEQLSPVKRRVALKLIKAGMDSARIVQRFEAERQALAMMDHPCIAKVFDAGTTPDGRPFFAMELVKGVPITKYCDEVHATLAERLELFVQACGAVQHAHQKGIIHRDLKPSNILVAMHDGVAAPKVIDFGVAKALHTKLAEHTLYTEIGQVVGTLEYMAPEQAELSAMDIDTRADVYALGVLMYELLAGSTPITRARLKSAGFAEILRVIKEEEPPRPSNRLTASNESLPSLAAQRRMEPKKLAKALAGELDWIALKALEKNRARRYETANALAADVRRYLADEPVEARPPSRAYRLQKFYRRNKALVGGAVFFTLALLLGIVGTSWGLGLAKIAEADARNRFQEAETERKKADDHRQKAEAALLAEAKQRQTAERNFLNGILRPIGTDEGPSLNVAEMKCYADWSMIDDQRLKLQGLEAAFEQPETALRIARRAAHVVQACVGISPTRRKRALALVSAKQRDRTANPQIRVAACWLGLELGSSDLPALAESIEVLARDPSTVSKEFGEFVMFAIDRSDPSQQRRNDEVIGDALAALLGKSENRYVLLVAGQGLTALAPKMSAVKAKLAFDALVTALGKSTDTDALYAVGEAMAALAARLEAAEAKRCFDALVAAPGKSIDGSVLFAALKGLTALAPRLDAAEAQREFDELISLDDKHSFTYKVRIALAFTPRLDMAGAKRGFNAFVSPLEKNSESDSALEEAADGLTMLAPWLDGAEAKRGFDALVAALGKKSTDSDASKSAGKGFRAIAPRLDRGAAPQVFDALVALLYKCTDGNVLEATADGLTALAPRLEGAEAKRGFDALVASLGKISNPSALYAAGRGLITLAPVLDAAHIQVGVDGLVAVLGKSTDTDAVRAAAMGLTALAPRMNASEAKRGFEALVAVLGNKFMDAYALEAVGEGFVGLAPRLRPAEVPHQFDALVALLDKHSGYYGSDAVAQGISTLASRLDAAEAKRGFDPLIHLLGTSTDTIALRAAAMGLTALAPRMNAAAAKRGFDALVGLVSRPNHSFVLQSAGRGFIAFAPRLDVAETKRNADALVALLYRSTDASAVEAAAMGLTALAPRLDPAEAMRGFDALIVILDKSSYPPALYEAGRGLMALAPRINAAEAMHEFDSLVGLVGRSTHASALQAGGQGLMALAPRLPTDDVRRKQMTLALALALKRLGLPDVRHGDKSEVHKPMVDLAGMLILGIDDPRALARLLSHHACVGEMRGRSWAMDRSDEIGTSHPTCVGELRARLLSRFEELTIHAGKPLPQPQAFFNVHDAADWISKNWPDFDLETPLPGA